MSPAPHEPDDGRGEITPQEREAFRKRAEDLGRRLESARGQETARSGRRDGRGAANDGALGRALRTSTELVGGVVVGSVIGWVIDTKWLNTWPLFFIVFFLLGAAAGMLNVYRSAMQVKTGLQVKAGPNNPKSGPSAPDDADDA